MTRVIRANAFDMNCVAHQSRGKIGGIGHRFVGSGADVADQLQEWVDETVPARGTASAGRCRRASPTVGAVVVSLGRVTTEQPLGAS